jgi:hypothetical protein
VLRVSKGIKPFETFLFAKEKVSSSSRDQKFVGLQVQRMVGDLLFLRIGSIARVVARFEEGTAISA